MIMNEIKEELYQSMMIGNLTISSDTSKQILDYIEEKDKEIERLKKDLINLLRIIDKNCDDLEGTEEEFDSLDRAEDLLKKIERR